MITGTKGFFEDLPAAVAENLQQEAELSLRGPDMNHRGRVLGANANSSLRSASKDVRDPAIKITTMPDAKRVKGRDQPDRICQTDAQRPVAYAADLLKDFARLDEIQSRLRIRQEKTMCGNEASLGERSLTSRNLESLGTAYPTGRVPIEFNGLVAEWLTAQREVHAWSMSRSPINTRCHGCLRIICSQPGCSEYHQNPSPSIQVPFADSWKRAYLIWMAAAR